MFRFSIRDLLVVMLAAAMAAGWLVESRRVRQLELTRQRLEARAQHLEAQIRRLNQTVEGISAAWRQDLRAIPPGPLGAGESTE